jgi:hypothetical protein
MKVERVVVLNALAEDHGCAVGYLYLRRLFLGIVF